MKQGLDFEQLTPPVLSEEKLQEKLVQRTVRRVTVLLAAAGVLLEAALIAFGITFAGQYPFLPAACLLHAVLSAAGSSVIAVIFTQKGGNSI